MIFSLLLLQYLFSLSSAQTACQDAGNMGPLLNGGCPGGLTPTDEGVCCTPDSVIGTPLDATAATSTVATTIVGVSSGGSTAVTVQPGSNSSCSDKTNPRTGASDCPSRSFLCNDALYYTLMTQQCPKTCGRCSSTFVTGSGSCQDLKNPMRGTSDCPSIASLCSDANYVSLMKVQCPKTCGFCSSTGSTATTAATSSGTCADLKNPATGSSDCVSRKSLCQDANYASVMKVQCPATCGFCSG